MSDPKNYTRRMTNRRVTKTRTNISVGKVDTQEHNTKKEPEFNMNAIIQKNLTHDDPIKGTGNVYYSYIENKYKPIENTEQYLNILDIDESLLHKEDNQAVSQEEYHSKKKKLKSQVIKEGVGINELEVDSLKSMRNRLTYCERASETIHKNIIQRDCETMKLNRVDHDGIFHQWDRFDNYMNNFLRDIEKKRQDEEYKMKGKITERKKVEKFSDSLNRPSLYKALKLLERQIMQIRNGDKYLFYREWRQFDESQDSSKMLYMLLSFPQNARIKNRSVTALCWNTKFEDLFAVGYGNYDFPSKKEDKGDLDNNLDDQSETGYIYVFSIKNNFFPEVKYTTESGVLSLDFHPKNFSYLVAGFYDGTVGVFDISSKSKAPLIMCDIRNQKHMDPVWQVKWYTAFNEPGEYVFYSISSDGRVIKWSFYNNKTTLETEEVLKLKYSDVLQQDKQNQQNQQVDLNNTQNTAMNTNMSEINASQAKEDEAIAFGNAGGMCFDFNKHKGFEHFFIVGTEEGKIYLCSTQHREHTINNFEGHSMAVYTVSWNPFHPKVFASCSADWTIKIWHYKTYAPLMVYDMQSAIGDLSWSPWCSTIFATVNVQGDIKFFDLNRARKAPLEPKRYKDAAINHIAFNKNEFVFITGNDRGKVHLWKMAEPLRVTIDKKELEEKEKEKKAKEANQNNLPTTKVVIPANLREDNVKQRKTYIKKKQIMVDLNPETEKKRIDEFLGLLDITDI